MRSPPPSPRNAAATRPSRCRSISSPRPRRASIRTGAYQYTEYYNSATPAAVTFREYYNLQADPYQLVNLLADGVPSNDPDTAPLSQTLRAARQCVGASCP